MQQEQSAEFNLLGSFHSIRNDRWLKNSNHCSACLKEIEPVSGNELCMHCMSSLFPETTHLGFIVGTPRHLPVENDTDEKGTFSIGHCNLCAAVQFKQLDQGNLTTKYYYVGQAKPEKFANPCVSSGYHENIEACTHDWITIHTKVNLDKHEAADRFPQEVVRLRDNYPNWDSSSYARFAERSLYGEKYCWCYKCGHYKIPSNGPSFELPSEGW